AFQSRSYPDSQNIFIQGRAVIYPAGSWDIATFRAKKPDFELGAFPPPVADGASNCYISDHVDIAIGINAQTKHLEAAKQFVEWAGTEEFAALYVNSLPGFFTLSNFDTRIDDPLAREFLSWRGKCQRTIRNSYQILSRGIPNLENELWEVSALVVNQEMSPEVAAKRLQDGLNKWFKPIPDFR